MRLRDRSAAGRLLAPKLSHYEGYRPVVLAIPCGGIPVAAEVARSLRAPLDVAVVQKGGELRRAERGVVVVAEEGCLHLLEEPADEAEIARPEAAELERRVRHFRAGRRPIDVKGRTVILVDDGAATGLTCRAAIASLRQQAPARVVLAVPVMPAPLADELGAIADEVVCLVAPESLWTIASWYGDFGRLSDDEASACLARARAASPKAPQTVSRPPPRVEQRWAFW
ncbi:MAG: phosphoribosyltransferase [Polyangiaceae bacterium]|nr:phosphoribosyltransferase [Polyangiaceae bacterium]